MKQEIGAAPPLGPVQSTNCHRDKTMESEDSLVAAGNASPDAWIEYPDGNLVEEIHDPGQSWNAVTVGAFTELTEIRDSTGGI